MSTEDLEARLSAFVADSAPALDQLRSFVGGELSARLDESPSSLSLLDSFVRNLTAEPDWAESPLFDGLNIARWLTVRIAYYFGSVVQRVGGGGWYLAPASSPPNHSIPVIAISGIELSPLEIARAVVEGRADGGLEGVFQELLAALKTGVN